MAKVTSKRQVTLPKHVADAHGIRPGDEIEFVSTAGGIRVIRPGEQAAAPDTRQRLESFDDATARQRARQRQTPRASAPAGRGWTRDALHDRARAR